jgi:hypothetical protein
MASRGGVGRARDGGAAHEGFLRHRNFLWLKVALLVSATAAGGYAAIDVQPRHNGGSAFGYALGTLGAVMILWLTMLGVRKRAMTRGRWSLKGWTSAHAWLGLSLAVVGTLHTGLQLGWNVHSLAWLLMMLVILSGLYGVVVYAALPPRLSESRGDMTRPQMIDAVAKIDRQLQLAAQPLAHEDTAAVRRALAEDPLGAGFWRRLTGLYPRSPTARALRELGARHGAAFQPVVALLERRAEALARIRTHLRIKALLEVWLYVHVPLTFALIAALAAHIFSVFFYW